MIDSDLRRSQSFIFLLLALFIAALPLDYSSAAVLNSWHGTNTLYDVAYGNNAFVAVGDSGIIITSPDGVNWTAGVSGTTETLKDVTYGDGKFVIPSGIILSGQTWGQMILSSPDGASWNGTFNPNVLSDMVWIKRIIYSNGIYVGVGGGDPTQRCGSYFYKSLDGVTYTPKCHEGEIWGSMTAVAYGNGTYVAMGLSLGNLSVYTSSDGEYWSFSPNATDFYLLISVDLVFGNGIFVQVISSEDTSVYPPLPSNVVRTSTGGIIWKQVATAGNVLQGVSYENGIFFATGNNGTILTSTDGETWVSRTSGTDKTLYRVAHGNGLFVAVGEQGTILTSLDGITWDTLYSSRLSGHVRLGSSGLPGVTLTGLPGNPVTDENGLYSADVTYGWNGTVRPTKFGYSFLPSSLTYNNITSDQTDQDYIAISNQLVAIGSGNGKRGDPVTVPITLTNVGGPGVAAVSVDIGFDPGVLENPTAVLGPAGRAAGKDIVVNAVSPGLFRVGVLSLSNSDAIGNGVIAYVTFNIKTSAAIGQTILTNTPSASDPSGAAVGVSASNGSVNVTSFASGDCNNDGTVSISEVQSAVNTFLGRIPVPSCVDASGNGNVSIGEVQKVINNYLGISGLGIFVAGKAAIWGEGLQIAGVSGQPSLNLGVKTGKPGETVTMPLALKNVSGYEVSALSSDIEYDTDKLENPVVTLGSAGQAAGKTAVFNVVTPGLLRIGVVSMAGNTPIGDGIVANVNFSIKANAPDAGVVLNNSPACSDSLGGDVTATGKRGIININMNNFGDVPSGSWAESFINAMRNFDITAGCGNGNYCPDSPVTRAQMAVFLLTTMGEQPAAVCMGMFDDVNANTVGETFCKFIEKLATLGITGGCGNGNFCPNDPVTREQMAVFMTTALQQGPEASCDGTFNDVSAWTVGDVFCRFIEKFATLGITSGCGNGNYCPSDPVTRAQMAVFLTTGFLQ